VKLNASFVLVGLTGCDVGVSWLLPRLVGASVATEMLLTGRTIGAERAQAIGLVAEVVPGSSLEATAERTVAELLNATPLALRLTKQALQTNLAAPSFEAAIDLEDRQQTLMALQPEFSERMRAFAARAKR
jgi:enoyl-CoA hydratase/carnithine racemase